MALLVIANQQKGPLPLTLPFNSPTDGQASLMITGSVWTGTANQLIGIQVTLDGQPIGSAEIYSNLATTHRAVVPTYIPVKLKIGAHKVGLQVLNSVTTSDFNDFFDVVLFY